MGALSRRVLLKTTAGLWLLAPLVMTGCASTQESKSGDGLGAFGGGTASTDKSWTDKLSAPFKKDASVASDNRASTANDADALSLSKKPNKKNPELIVAIAQMHERAGKLDDAEEQYKKALKISPKHLGALVGYAHLQDRRSKLDDAVVLYKKAIAAHPKEAAVQNDLGLCYHRNGKLPEAATALNKAIELAPDRKLYRNNLATVLVEQGQLDAAMAQLTMAHGQAAGNYNMGYLLAKKGDTNRALYHFDQAAMLDPSLTAARQWIAKLSPPSNGPMMAAPAPRQEIAVPEVAQRNVTVSQPIQPGASSAAVPPQPGVGPRYLQTSPPAGTYQGASGQPWTAPPTAVRYPNQQTSGYTGTAALPPTPTQTR